MAEVKEMALTPEQIEKAKAAKREYMREWRRKHKAEVQAASLRYWARKAAEAEETTGR